MKKICIVFVFFLFSFQLFAEEEKLKIAVMEFEDKSGQFSQETLEAAADILRDMFRDSGHYVVISKSRQKDQVSKIRKEYNTNMAYKSCTDKNCQIQLGQALSADVIVQTTITSFAETFTISSDLTDLEKEATEIGGKAKFDGSEKSMEHALESIVQQIYEKYTENSRDPKDERDCERARGENSFEGWITYTRKHENGVCAEEAEEILDDMSCKKAEQDRKIQGYRLYLQHHPNGRCSIRFTRELRERENKNCEEAQQYTARYLSGGGRYEYDGAIRQWESYLEDFPEGNCAEEAKKQRSDLNEKEKKRKENDVPADNNIIGQVFTGRFNFGMAAMFEGTTKPGINLGMDFNFNLFQPKGIGGGSLYAGLSFDFAWYIPTDKNDNWLKVHLVEIPLMVNLGYDFRINTRALRFIGLWFAAGGGIHVFCWEDPDETKSNTYTSFAWEVGLDLIFRSSFMMNFGVAGFTSDGFHKQTNNDGTHLFFNIGTIF